MLNHPCFQKSACKWFENIHIAVAPRCNMKCNYCGHMSDCINENKPGISSKVLTPRQAYLKVFRVIKNNNHLKVVGVSGPGEPLANRDTFKALDWIHREFPQLIKCVSTNGLLLQDSMEYLMKVGVEAISVTINGVDPVIVADISPWLTYKDKLYEGREAAEILIQKQLQGIKEAVSNGIKVKINSILIPGVNDLHLWQVAMQAKAVGASLMNIRPLVPQCEFIFYPAPLSSEIESARKTFSRILPLTPPCGNCADSLEINKGVEEYSY